MFKFIWAKLPLWKILVYWFSSFWFLDINSYLAFEGKKKFQSRKYFKCIRKKKSEIFHHLINEAQNHKRQKCLSSLDNGFGCEQGRRASSLRTEAYNDAFSLRYPLPTKCIHDDSLHYVHSFRNNYCASMWKFSHSKEAGSSIISMWYGFARCQMN